VDDFPVEAGTFYVPGPVWVLERKVESKVGYAGGRTSKARYLYVFTDLHLAEKHLEEGGSPGYVPSELTSKEAYASLLEMVQSGYDRVAYDPPAGGRIRTSFTIAEVIKDARRPGGQAEK
jgi:hypothetical protein